MASAEEMQLDSNPQPLSLPIECGFTLKRVRDMIGRYSAEELFILKIYCRKMIPYAYVNQLF